MKQGKDPSIYLHPVRTGLSAIKMSIRVNMQFVVETKIHSGTRVDADVWGGILEGFNLYDTFTAAIDGGHRG